MSVRPDTFHRRISELEAVQLALISIIRSNGGPVHYSNLLTGDHLVFEFEYYRNAHMDFDCEFNDTSESSEFQSFTTSFGHPPDQSMISIILQVSDRRRGRESECVLTLKEFKNEVQTLVSY